MRLAKEMAGPGLQTRPRRFPAVSVAHYSVCPCSRIAPAPFVAKEAGYAQTSSLALTTAFRLRRPASAPPIAAANASGTANPQRFSRANAAAGFRPDMRLATLEMSPNAIVDGLHTFPISSLG